MNTYGRTSVLIPAHNESATIGPILEQCINARHISKIVVVADKCDDNTASIANDYGVKVHVINAGDKGTAIEEGLNSINSEYTLLLDGDLTGITSKNIDDFALHESFGQVVGVRGKAVRTFKSLPPLGLPPIGGERRVHTYVLRSMSLRNIGYGLEMQINERYKNLGLPTHYLYMNNVDQVTQYQKWDFWHATRKDFTRWIQVLKNMRKAL